MTDAKRVLNYTTAVPVTKTVGECQHLLAQAGADAVAVLYKDKQPAGLAFSLSTPHGNRDFTLPVNVDGVHRLLSEMDYGPNSRPVRTNVYRTREHAAAVAWRVIKDWLEAQLALIDAEMATLTEIMLPYLQIEPGRTLWQAYQDNERKALEAGSDG